MAPQMKTCAQASGAQANGCATTFAARFVYMVLVVSISKFVSEFEVWIVRKAGGLCV